jgi:hypothetical protein
VHSEYADVLDIEINHYLLLFEGDFKKSIKAAYLTEANERSLSVL